MRIEQIERELEEIEALLKADPGDYMIEFDRDEMKAKLQSLLKREKIGLRLVLSSEE